jgi:hypothetical protein
MAHKISDRIMDSTTTTGTGTVTLSGSAPSGFQTFGSLLSTNDTTFYCIVDQSGSDWEVGLGTYNSTGPTLARTTVLSSSNSGSLVSFPAGTKNVFITAPAESVAINDNTGTIKLPDMGTGAPTTPGATSANIFSRQIANRNLPAFIGPSGLDSALQPLLARNKIGYWNPPGNTTTVPGIFGFYTPSTSGTATARTVATTNLATRMRRLAYTTTTTATTGVCGHYSPVAQFTCGSGSNDGSGVFYVCRFVPSWTAANTGARMFVGLSSSTSALSNATDPSALTNCIGVGQLSGDETQLYIVYGGSSAQASIALGATNFPAQTLSTTAFEIAIFAPASVANTWYVQVTNITNMTVATVQTLTGSSTVVPQSTTLMAHRAWAGCTTASAACAIDICSVYYETDT